MALSKSVEVGNTGLNLSYHKINGFIYESELGDIMKLQVGLYESKESSHAGKHPIYSSTVKIDFSSLSGTGDIRAQLYDVLKAMPDYSGATDV